MQLLRKVTPIVLTVALLVTTSILAGCQNAQRADVVVIGGGGAGLAAAVTAADKGAKVILLEKMPMLGGNTLRAQTGMNAAGTKYQAAQGINDTPEIHYQDTMKGGKEKNDPELVRTLAEKASDAVEWLNSLGANLTRVMLLGGATNPRTHAPAEGGYAGPIMINVLQKAAKDKGVQIYTDTKATQILVDKNNRVTGVKAVGKDGKELQFRAKAVIIATGGFGANPEMVEQYNPKLKGFDTTNHPGATGDGIKMATAIGAAVRDMEYIQTHPTVVPKKGILIAEGMRGAGAILVNHNGERFIDELQTRDVVSEAILSQKGKTAFLIFDQAIRDESKLVEEEAQKNSLVSGATLDELAQKIGVPADKLKDTISKYNSYVQSGKDPDCGRTKLAKKIETAPFYAVEVTPAIHHTMGGLVINTKAQVLGQDNKPIPGLYAAGEVTGGVHGANRLGGNALTDIIVFGRIAGEEAAAFAKAK
ncbi:MAG TPA: flavocytochrome c [Firmicutes bacterium]|nr:flavocytochrome c [Candidatus Fermentithermobacillaceae bacterium]